ncbi:hypothetical protein GOODEAATRI_006515 [Goodea atripinnis]|uniref:Uncharacterized protein n=1 Tax=Goodea atripinnis TaxID=208336 RepID=A0ABV0P207_9TELE
MYIEHMPPRPNAMSPFPTGTLPRMSSTLEKPLKTSTQHKLHTQPRFNHPCRILPSTTQHTDSKARTPHNATPASPFKRRGPLLAAGTQGRRPPPFPRNHTQYI